MPSSDIYLVVRWWGTLFFVGAAAYPFTRRLFHTWHDQGYVMAKAVGLVSISWIVYVLGMARLASFRETSIFFATGAVFVLGMMLHRTSTPREHPVRAKRNALAIAGEELLFFVALVYWSFIKAHEPSIRGLEKFMDYGFMQSILQSTYFPPADMWFPPFPINYYYFGHLVTALLTRLSGLDLSVTFNLMLSTLFAFCFTMSYSIGYELIIRAGFVRRAKRLVAAVSGGLTAFLVTLGGNMQTLYAFTKGYTGEDVKPFWELLWGGHEFWQKLPEGMLRYWYANATRFIPFTIHEFPSYSFVVSDIHGHVLSIPFVLLALGLLIAIFGSVRETEDGLKASSSDRLLVGFYGFLCGALLMTNALDGPIYMGLFLLIYIGSRWRMVAAIPRYWKYIATDLSILIIPALISSMPFLSHFKSFVNGIAVNCPLPFVANSKIGPLLFEGMEKCQRSPVWMLWLLWGFFWYCGLMLSIAALRRQVPRMEERKKSFISYIGYKLNSLRVGFTHNEMLLMLWWMFGVLLIIFPEFFYFKDIYPQHFRSNTMFKLGYQAFIMWGIVSGYAIIRFLAEKKPGKTWAIVKGVILIVLVPQLFLVAVYPSFSVRSYFGALTKYEGLNGLLWFAREYPDDFAATMWLKDQQSRCSETPMCPRYTLVEADGDSYTDYERFSVFSGTPTIIGWAVHEWLWRGTYDVVSPRREEVRKVYESDSPEETREILTRYNVRYVVVGSIEREKYAGLAEWKFAELGVEVYRSNKTVIYMIR